MRKIERGSLNAGEYFRPQIYCQHSLIIIPLPLVKNVLSFALIKEVVMLNNIFVFSEDNSETISLSLSLTELCFLSLFYQLSDKC